MTLKKNWTIRAAVLMLALVLITLCFVGGTFAKYVTGGSGSDSARVAKFGVAVTANGTMFAKEYATDDPGAVGTIAKSVVSSDDSKLVAPGTKGDMVSVVLTGTPEVAVKVTYDATGKVALNNWTQEDGSFYCPLVFKIKGETTTVIYGVDYNTAALLQNDIENAIKGYSKSYPAKTDLSLLGAESVGVSWEWPFETGENADAKAANNVKDTYLGKQAADGNAATVSVEIAATVTQID